MIFTKPDQPPRLSDRLAGFIWTMWTIKNVKLFIAKTKQPVGLAY